MAIKDVVAGLKDVVTEMRNLAEASTAVAQINNEGGAPGGGNVQPIPPPQAPPAPINLTFVSNITTPPSISTGGGGISNEASSQSDEFINFLRTRGIYDIKKANEQTIMALKLEFEFLLKKMFSNTGGIAFRKIGAG